MTGSRQALAPWLLQQKGPRVLNRGPGNAEIALRFQCKKPRWVRRAPLRVTRCKNRTSDEENPARPAGSGFASRGTSPATKGGATGLRLGCKRRGSVYDLTAIDTLAGNRVDFIGRYACLQRLRVRQGGLWPDHRKGGIWPRGIPEAFSFGPLRRAPRGGFGAAARSAPAPPPGWRRRSPSRCGRLARPHA